MSSHRALDPDNKRSIGNLVDCHFNFVLPVHTVTRIKRAPRSPTQATVQLPGHQSVEARFQLSLRTRALQRAWRQKGRMPVEPRPPR